MDVYCQGATPRPRAAEQCAGWRRGRSAAVGPMQAPALPPPPPPPASPRPRRRSCAAAACARRRRAQRRPGQRRARRAARRRWPLRPTVHGDGPGQAEAAAVDLAEGGWQAARASGSADLFVVASLLFSGTDFEESNINFLISQIYHKSHAALCLGTHPGTYLSFRSLCSCHRLVDTFVVSATLPVSHSIFHAFTYACHQRLFNKLCQQRKAISCLISQFFESPNASTSR